MANVITHPKDLSNAYWQAIGVTVADNILVSPDGLTQGSRLTNTAAHVLRINPGVTVSASTAYVWQFWALKGTATAAQYEVFDASHSAYIITDTDYLSLINSSTWTLINAPFTTPAGCTSVQLEISHDTTTSGTLGLWFAYLDKTSAVPANAFTPVVTGTPTTGSTLTTTDGGWFHDNGVGTRAYQWQRDNHGGGVYSNIGSATSSSYTLTTADSSCNVRSVVTATNTNGTQTANSNSALDTSAASPTALMMGV